MEIADSRKQIDPKLHHYRNTTQSRNIKKEATENIVLMTSRKGCGHPRRRGRRGREQSNWRDHCRQRQQDPNSRKNGLPGTESPACGTGAAKRKGRFRGEMCRTPRLSLHHVSGQNHTEQSQDTSGEGPVFAFKEVLLRPSGR